MLYAAPNTYLFVQIDLQLTCDVGANAETSPIDKRLNALVRHESEAAYERIMHFRGFEMVIGDNTISVTPPASGPQP